MHLTDLFSLSYPKDHTARQEVFLAKVSRFFSYSISNMLGLIYGAFLISLVLYAEQTPLHLVVSYFLVTGAIAVSVLFISLYVERHKPDGPVLEKLLTARVVLGCLIGVMYGLACFLLPAQASSDGVALLIMIYLVSISVAIFQYSVIPLYYILFNLSIYLPLGYYLAINPPPHAALLVVFLISGTLIFIMKGLKVSINQIEAIIAHHRLEHEVAEHLVTRSKLQHMALYDGLTKIANRHLFNKSAETSLARAQAQGGTVVLLYADLNNFKGINDQYGHAVGDRILLEAANAIRSEVRSSDLVARLGGDEFAVILETGEGMGVPSLLIEKIRKSLDKRVIVDGHCIHLCASIGYASYPHDGQTIDEILNKADTRMYQEKVASRAGALA